MWLTRATIRAYAEAVLPGIEDEEWAQEYIDALFAGDRCTTWSATVASDVLTSVHHSMLGYDPETAFSPPRSPGEKYAAHWLQLILARGDLCVNHTFPPLSIFE